MLHLRARPGFLNFAYAGSEYKVGADGMIHGVPDAAADVARAHGWEVYTDKQYVDLAAEKSGHSNRGKR